MTKCRDDDCGHRRCVREREEMAAYVAATVAKFPPLSDAQIEKTATLLRLSPNG